VAAAAAEVVQLTRGSYSFDAASRFYLSLGVLAALVAGALGWCAAGFRISADSWIVSMHRWAGTSTVSCAGLLLVLSERRRRQDDEQTRTWFRLALFAAALLVLVTGFLGGAVVYGLKHYAWPR
jgi:uncharacterized membrane protein